MVAEGQRLNNPQRLADLDETGLLLISKDPSFHRFVRLAARMMKAPVSLVSLVTNEKQHFVGSCGLDGDLEDLVETPLTHSFCQHVVTSGEPLLVSNAKNDPRVCDNGAIADLGVVSYLGVPIVSSKGNILGSFCVIGGEPREWSEDELEFMQDLKAAVCAEIELRRQTDQLQKSVRELEDAHVRNDEMVHMIIHDLRNPLAGIQGGVDLLRTSTTEQTEDHEILSAMDEGCVQMMDLIGDILESSKIQNAEVPLALSPVGLPSLFRELARQVELLSQSRSIQMQWSVDGGPKEIMADRRLLKRMLQNLLINAFKFSPMGGKVEFSVETSGDGGSAVFLISDTGPGIAEEERESIFGKFVVGKSATARSIGLGLNFCRIVAEAHRGSVSVVEGPAGVGSTFRVELPLSTHR